jgi:hypothetical protein
MRGKAGRLGRFQPPFSPTSLAVLTGWWDASDPGTLFDATSGGSAVSADGGVARLEDKSGNGRHFTQGTAGNRPKRKTAQRNGLDVLRFNGSSERMDGPIFSTLFASSASTCFIVAKATTAPSNDATAPFNAAALSEVAGAHGFFGVRSNSTAYSFGLDTESSKQTSLSYTTGNWVCFSTDHDSPTFRVTINKTTSATESLGGRGFTNFSTILGANYNQDFFWDGDVGEIITYNVALSATDREAVETYLMSKWGIS